MKKKRESFFWTSYSDLMTSLFFIMLVLFGVLYATSDPNLKAENEMLKAENEMLKAENEMLKAENDSLRGRVAIDSTLIVQIQKLSKAEKLIPKEYFKEMDNGDGYLMKNITVRFKSRSSDMNNIDDWEKEKLKEVGKSLYNRFNKLKRDDEYKDVVYMLIIEGQASKDNYTQNDELSYERALALKKFWQANGYNFKNLSNCKIYVSGSGVWGYNRENDEEANQRFVIRVVPIPSSIIKQTQQQT